MWEVMYPRVERPEGARRFHQGDDEEEAGNGDEALKDGNEGEKRKAKKDKKETTSGEKGKKGKGSPKGKGKSKSKAE
jgi:hypothetical protein